MYVYFLSFYTQMTVAELCSEMGSYTHTGFDCNMTKPLHVVNAMNWKDCTILPPLATNATSRIYAAPMMMQQQHSCQAQSGQEEQYSYHQEQEQLKLQKMQLQAQMQQQQNDQEILQQQQQQQQQYQEEEEQQQQQYQEEEQQQQYQEDEDEDEEDEDEDEEDDQNDENENQSFEEIHEEDPDDDQHQSQEQQQLQQQIQQQQTHDAHDGIHVEETENMEYDERFNTVSPIVPSEVPPQEKEKARESWTKANPFIEALGLSRKLVQEAATLVDKQQRWSFNDAGGSGNVHKADEEVRDQPAPNVNAKVEETKESTKEEDTNGRWIISSLMNTFECQGTGLTTEENTSSGPIGLMTCGPQAEPNPKSKVEESAQDDEDDNSVLGPKAFGDLDSLPSLDDSVLQNGGVDQGDDAVSLSSRVSRASMATEYLGNAVDDKMHDIKNEKKQDLFQEKLFDPATETSVDQEQSEEIMVANDPNVQRMVKELQETIKANGEYHVRCANLSSTLAQKYTDLKAPKKALRLQTKVVSIFSS